MVEKGLSLDDEKMEAEYKLTLTGKDIVYLVFSVGYRQMRLEENEVRTERYYEEIKQKLIKAYNEEEKIMVDFEDLISRKKIRFELGESTMPKKYRDFCVKVIDDEKLTPRVCISSPSEDLRDWIVDCWDIEVKDNIGFAISTMIVDKNIKNDLEDREEFVEFISERIKDGVLNILDTYNGGL